MKAIVYHQYGGPDQLQLQEIAKPTPKEDELLVRIHATSVNDWDWGLLHGDFINRLLFGWRKPGRRILGSDIAGVVELTGKNVKRFSPGDKVYGDLSGQWGGFAEYVCVKEKSVGLMSPGMSYEEAAAIPQAAMLAVQGLIDRAQVKKGQQILLNGAGGGVGTFAIQLARLYDAEITVVDSAEKLEMLRAMGAHHAIDYRVEDFTTTGKQYDIILDVKTNRSPLRYAKALKRHGVYATVGGSMSRFLQMLVLSPFVSMLFKKRLRIVALKTNKDLAYMNELFEAGKVKPVIDGRYDLTEVPAAMQFFGTARHKGKLVISVASPRE